MKKTVTAAAMLWVIAAPVCVGNIYWFGLSAAAMLIPVCCVLPSFVIFYVLAKHRDLRFFFTFCFADTIVLWIMVLTKLLDVAFGVDGYLIMFLSRIVLTLATECIIYKFLRKPYQAMQGKIKKGWGLFSITGILFYIALLFYAFVPELITPDYITSLPLLFLLTILPVMYTTIYILIQSQIEHAEAKEQNEVLSMQIKMAQERIKSNTYREEATKIIRHDMRHHLVLLQDYLDRGETEKALAYIRSISQTIDQSTPMQFCRNNSLNAVLCFYDSLAKEQNIDFQAKVSLPETLFVAEQDLVVILSNAIENAVKYMTETQTPGTVTVRAREEKGALLLQVKNPCLHKVQFVDGLPVSNRKKGEHGLGAKSMVHLIQKHGGLYSFTWEDGEFVFRCSIARLEEKPETEHNPYYV